MHEIMGNEFSSSELTELEIARLDKNLNNLLSPTDISNIEGSTDYKNDALDQVAQLFVDDNKRDAVTRLIIEKHNTSEGMPDYALYAYWAISLRAHKLAADVPIPTDFANFILSLAKAQGDQDIAFQLIMLSSYVDENEPEIERLEISKELSVTHSSLLEKLRQNKINVMDQFSSTVQSTSDLLSTITSDAHIVDRERLFLRTKRFTDLWLDIANNKFMTPQGLAAAKVQQDFDRLEARDGRPQDLWLDIANNKFMTPQGLAAAKVQHDLDRLVLRTKRFTDLWLDIANNKFMTPQGLAAAKVQHDLDRLEARKSKLQDLRNDLFSGKILTYEGIQEARNILGIS